MSSTAFTIAADVWLVALPARPVACDIATCHTVLDGEERQRAARFLNESAREQSIVAHAVTRVMLSTFATTPPAAWAFARARFGKPFIAEPQADAPALRFSLSHTDGLVACAVSRDVDVGVDVEAWQRPVVVADFSKCLSVAETDELSPLGGDDQRRRFFEIWTAKEAYVKGLGTGLSSKLPTVTIRDAAGSRPRLVDLTPTHADWHLHRIRTDDRHAAAVAVARDGAVQVRRLVFSEFLQLLGAALLVAE